MNLSLRINHKHGIHTYIKKGEGITLIWQSYGADNCVGIGPGFVTGGNVRGEVRVNNIVRKTTYMLRCSNSSTKQSMITYAWVTIGSPPVTPKAWITVKPRNINLGEKAVLTWGSQNADRCELSHSASKRIIWNKVATSGTVVVSPISTRAYYLNCSRGNLSKGYRGGYRRRGARADLSVTQPQQSADLARKNTINPPPTKCSNKIDDDGDGLIDEKDPGCHKDGKPPGSSSSGGGGGSGSGGSSSSGGSSGGGTYDPKIDVEEDLDITATPRVVPRNTPTTVTWKATGSPTSCVVTGTNGFSQSGTSGSASSGALTEETFFTLTCTYDGYTRSKTARAAILPTFEEF